MMAITSSTMAEGANVSSHYDGERFFNPSRRGGKRFGDLIKWWTTEEKKAWPEWIANESMPNLPVEIPAGEVHVTFINHATFLIRTSTWSLLTDPQFSERASPFGF